MHGVLAQRSLPAPTRLGDGRSKVPWSCDRAIQAHLEPVHHSAANKGLLQPEGSLQSIM